MEGAVINRVINGVDVDQMRKTIEAINSHPELAKFLFRENNVSSTDSCSRPTIIGLYAAGQEDTIRRNAFMLQADGISVEKK